MVARFQALTVHADLAAWGVTFDLTITLPLLYWFLVVRTGRARPLTIAPVFLAGTLAAAALLPSPQDAFATQLRIAAITVIEVVLVIALARRVIRRDRTRHTDVHDRIRAAARTIAGDGRVAGMLASELSVMYYAFFGWKQKPDPEERAVTFHERSGWDVAVAALLLLLAAEGLAMHLFLSQWSSHAAWGWTALDFWAALWLLGDYQALRLRRTTVDGDTLRLRLGMRWSVDVSNAQIASVEAIRDERDWKRPGVLRIAILEEPRLLVRLREPLVADGVAGWRREFRELALAPDDDTILREWLAGAPSASPADAAHLRHAMHP